MKGRVKKAFLILLCCMVFSVSMLRTQVDDTAYAFTGVEEAVVVGGTAYSAAALYVAGALVVSAGAGYLGLEYADEIKTHATSVWDKVDTTTKDAFNAAVSASLIAGDHTLTLSQDIADSLKTALTGSMDWIKNKIQAKQYFEATGSSFDSLADVNSLAGTSVAFMNMTGVKGIVPDPNVKFNINGNIYGGLRVRVYSGNLQLYLAPVGSTSTTQITFTSPTGSNSWSSIAPYLGLSTNLIDLDTMSEFLQLFTGLGFNIALDYGTPPSTTAMSERVNANLDNIGAGVTEVNLALDSWLYKSKSGQLLEWRPDATAWYLPDGSIYTGEVVVETPMPYVDAGSITADSPEVSLDNVKVGAGATSITSDLPTVGSGTVPDGETGILQGLWDWLKGILQAILDAIKALAGLLGLSELLNTIIGWITSIAEGVGAIVTTLTTGLVGSAENIQWEKLKMTAGVFTTKFPFSLPWDIQKALVAIFGGFNDSDSPPSWEYKMHVLGSEYKFTIGFPQLMVNWSPFIKGTILVMFDIGLVYAVRKLLGGAS